MLVFLVFCYFIASFSASSPETTVEISCSRSSPIESIIYESSDKIFKCNELFKEHFQRYTIRTSFSVPEGLDEFYTETFIKAVLFAANVPNNFKEVIYDSRISVPFHCFLLEYFLLVLIQEQGGSHCFHSQFIGNYSESIAINHGANSEDSHVINVHVFPLLNELVLTGNFLNYSFLLSTCVNRLDTKQKDKIYSSHCLQYFLRLNDQETTLEFETFKCGIEFLNLYIPRFEILSLIGIKNYDTVALNKPFGYYLIAFNPFKAVVEGKIVIDKELLEGVKRTPFLFKTEIEFFNHLESFLIQIDFLNFKNFEQFEIRKLVLNSFINLDKVGLFISCGLTTCFQVWIQFQYTSIDDWTRIILRSACYESSDKRFKLIYDNFIKE